MSGVVFPSEFAALIRIIESELYTQPESAAQRLRKLLLQCAGDAQLCYTYEHLGFAYLLLGEHRMSKVFYEQALHLQPDNAYILANLAHAVYELGDKQNGVEYGRRALRIKDETANSPGPHNIGKLHRGGKNLISFSLYGHKARYCETAVLNCQAARLHFPEFICRFHVDESVPRHVLERLQLLGAELLLIKGRIASFPKTFWRFLAMDDAQADIVLVRDADSIVDAREAQCVKEWISSDKPFHIIRDDCCHTELIHAGLFAARSGIVSQLEQRIASFLSLPQSQPIGRYSDQLFLRTCIWPIVRDHAVTHDRIYGYGTDVRATPPEICAAPGVHNVFMGANHASYGLQITTQEWFSDDALYFLRLIDVAGRQVCEYEMKLMGTQRLQIFLPQSYGTYLERREWRYEIYSENRQTHSRTLVGRSISPP